MRRNDCKYLELEHSTMAIAQHCKDMCLQMYCCFEVGVLFCFAGASPVPPPPPPLPPKSIMADAKFYSSRLNSGAAISILFFLFLILLGNRQVNSIQKKAKNLEN